MRCHVRKLFQLAIGARQFLGFFGQRLLGGFAGRDVPREAERADDSAIFVPQQLLGCGNPTDRSIRPGFLLFSIDHWLARADDFALIVECLLGMLGSKEIKIRFPDRFGRSG